MDEERDLPPRQPRCRRSERGYLGCRRHQAPAGAAIPAIPANEFFSFTCNALAPFNYLEDVGTFDVTNPIELRDNAAASTAFGVNGFNRRRCSVSTITRRTCTAAKPRPSRRCSRCMGWGRGSGFPPKTTIQTELTAADGRICWCS